MQTGGAGLSVSPPAGGIGCLNTRETEDSTGTRILECRGARVQDALSGGDTGCCIAWRCAWRRAAPSCRQRRDAVQRRRTNMSSPLPKHSRFRSLAISQMSRWGRPCRQSIGIASPPECLNPASLLGFRVPSALFWADAVGSLCGHLWARRGHWPVL